ncbi:MAG: tRNA (adenosine(37)-N6)-dimethylallyltransferase MiaA [Bacteroidales bacterium]|nr:tRNA (adenosine(37)-N6)-dimethylallyltransferase MiaA [Bacteroidales bacterium]
MENYNLISVIGPTASGKTSFAVNLANLLGGEIISADSRQVYRGMDIGTGKDYSAYRIGDTTIPYHLIDILDAGEEYNVYRYQEDFFKSYEDISQRGKIPVLCGGTGLYIEAVLKGYSLLNVPLNEDLRKELESQKDEDLVSRLKSYKNPHNTTDTIIRKRLIRAIEIEEYMLNHGMNTDKFPDLKPVLFGLDIDRESRRANITIRLEERLKEGMIEEAERLIKSGVTPEMLEFYGLEYKYLSRYLSGLISYNEMFSSLNTAIHQFAKRQMTWFRKMEREGFQIHWIDAKLPMHEKLQMAVEILK